MSGKPIDELHAYDWFVKHDTAPKTVYQPIYDSIMLIKTETEYERKFRMIRNLSTSCMSCSMCELGTKEASRFNEVRDPHIFSNANPTRFFITGYQPGWSELVGNKPFMGNTGTLINTELRRNSFSRNDFYINNIIRCYSETEPQESHKNQCQPFLQMEINLIRPLLVVAVGQQAFNSYCPNVDYHAAIKTISKSLVYNVSVFAVSDPSKDIDGFSEQIRIMCKLVTALRIKHKAYFDSVG